MKSETRHHANPAPPLPPLPPPLPGVASTALNLPEGATYWKICILESTAILPLGAVPREENLPPPAKKSILEAYMLWLPFGLLGFHHLYLGRPGFFIAYFLTLGLLGFGWLADLMRMPCLVSRVNKQRREQQEELVRLQRDSRQWQHPGRKMTFVSVTRKSLDDAYIMWFPFGIFGMHHFYLRNYGMGFLYLFTLGLLGVGWLVDLFRMPSLVKDSNKPILKVQQLEKSMCLAQTLAMTPAGLFGAHHYYLGRPAWGLLYTFTGGLFFTGWLADWFRTWNLAKRANAIRQGRVSPTKKYVDDAYILCIPWGFLGLHHFYLRRYGWGFFYLFTLGLLGIGWVIDWFRLPCLVKDVNKDIIQGQGRETVTVTPTSPLVGGAGGAQPGGLLNYGYQGQVIRPPPGLACYPTPAPGCPGGVVVAGAPAPGVPTPYGYQGHVAPPPPGLASHPTPAPGYKGYAYPAGYPVPTTYGVPHPGYAAGVGAMPPPPPPEYTAVDTQDTAAGEKAGTPPPSYQDSAK